MSGNYHINMDPTVGSSNELGDPSGESGDPSGPLFSIYSKMVEEGDSKRAERQQKDADGIIIFTGLFSAAVAALVPMSIQDLRPPNQQDNSTFSPPRYAIWVNSLWFSSLAISITSALLATLLQQWIRRHIKLIQPLGSPHKRARTRQFFFNGAGNLHFLLVTDAVPTLLHLSVFLFFAGLLILLRNTDNTVFDAVAVWVVLCVAVYTYTTFRPIFRPTSLHFTPLSSLIWQFYTDIQYFVFGPPSTTEEAIHCMNADHPARLLVRLEKKAEEMVLGQSPNIDACILGSLLNTLGDDGTREKFFEAIPGFYNSKVVKVKEVTKQLSKSPKFVTKFRHSIDQFVDQTLSSDSLSELARSRRLLTCLKATHTVLGGRAGVSITARIIRSEIWDEVPPSQEVGHILRRWRNSTDPWIAVIGSCLIARIIMGMQDDTWTALAVSQLGVTEKVFKRYRRHGDSVSLANLINATRLFVKKKLQFQDILRDLSNFSVKGTLPELQREFCTLWSEIVLRVQDGSSSDCAFILQEISSVYDALHPPAATDVAAPSASNSSNNDSLCSGFSYPICANTQSPHLPTATYVTASRRGSAPSITVSPQGTAPSINDPSDISHAPQQISPVATSAPSPRRDRTLSRPLRRNATNAIPDVVPDDPSVPSLTSLAPLSELSMEVHDLIAPALDPSYSTTTSYTLATPGEASVSDPSFPDISTSNSRPGKCLA